MYHHNRLVYVKFCQNGFYRSAWVIPLESIQIQQVITKYSVNKIYEV